MGKGQKRLPIVFVKLKINVNLTIVILGSHAGMVCKTSCKMISVSIISSSHKKKP